MRNVRALLVVTAMVSLTLGSAPSVFADDGVALTAAQETCLKKALTAAEFEQFLANPFDLGLKDKAKSCQVSGGLGQRHRGRGGEAWQGRHHGELDHCEPVRPVAGHRDQCVSVVLGA